MHDLLIVEIKSNASRARHTRRAAEKMQRIKDWESQKQSFKHDKDQPRPEPRKYPDPVEGSQERYDEAEAKYWNLHQSRTVTLRKQQRINHLALAFLRSVPYSTVEEKTHQDLTSFETRIIPSSGDRVKNKTIRRIFDAVERVAKTHFEDRSDTFEQVFQQKWAQWMDEAKAHLLKQHPENKHAEGTLNTDPISY